MNTILIICGAIILLGLLIFLFLVFKAKKKHKAIKHYESIRDSLTLREQEEKEKELNYKEYSGMSFGNIVGGFITILIGASLAPEVAKEVSNASANANLTGSAATILNLVPIFFVVVILFIAFSIGTNSLRSSGYVNRIERR